MSYGAPCLPAASSPGSDSRAGARILAQLGGVVGCVVRRGMDDLLRVTRSGSERTRRILPAASIRLTVEGCGGRRRREWYPAPPPRTEVSTRRSTFRNPHHKNELLVFMPIAGPRDESHRRLRWRASGPLLTRPSADLDARDRKGSGRSHRLDPVRAAVPSLAWEHVHPACRLRHPFTKSRHVQARVRIPSGSPPIRRPVPTWHVTDGARTLPAHVAPAGRDSVRP